MRDTASRKPPSWWMIPHRRNWRDLAADAQPGSRVRRHKGSYALERHLSGIGLRPRSAPSFRPALAALACILVPLATHPSSPSCFATPALRPIANQIWHTPIGCVTEATYKT